MSSGSRRVIVINGVRYNVAIRLDSAWSYVAEWWNHNGYHKYPLDDDDGATPEAERVAIHEIQKAHLEQEPWLYVEMADIEIPKDNSSVAMAHAD